MNETDYSVAIDDIEVLWETALGFADRDDMPGSTPVDRATNFVDTLVRFAFMDEYPEDNFVDEWNCVIATSDVLDTIEQVRAAVSRLSSQYGFTFNQIVYTNVNRNCVYFRVVNPHS